ncbi:hypothetical protein GCM10010350_78910 [Streptomyces galilaeus]|nr:hypothetical protein GCM10010350_78910 [Streptomyces galilaeus]
MVEHRMGRLGFPQVGPRPVPGALPPRHAGWLVGNWESEIFASRVVPALWSDPAAKIDASITPYLGVWVREEVTSCH